VLVDGAVLVDCDCFFQSSRCSKLSSRSTAATEAAAVDVSSSSANFTSCSKDKWGSDHKMRFLYIAVLADSRNPVQNVRKHSRSVASQQSLQQRFACAISAKDGKIHVQDVVLGKLIPRVVANPASSLHPLQSSRAVGFQILRTKRKFLRRYGTTIVQGRNGKTRGYCAQHDRVTRAKRAALMRKYLRMSIRNISSCWTSSSSPRNTGNLEACLGRG
jgi:hypothetical protein